MALFDGFWTYFMSVRSPEKMLNFSPQLVIWWTLNMYFWEVVNSLLCHSYEVGKRFTAL